MHNYRMSSSVIRIFSIHNFPEGQPDSCVCQILLSFHRLFEHLVQLVRDAASQSSARFSSTWSHSKNADGLSSAWGSRLLQRLSYVPGASNIPSFHTRITVSCQQTDYLSHLLPAQAQQLGGKFHASFLSVFLPSKSFKPTSENLFRFYTPWMKRKDGCNIQKSSR